MILVWHSYAAHARHLSADTLSVKVYFPCGSSDISRMSYNALSLERFMHHLDSLCLLPQTTPIGLTVTSSASPEGSIKINRALSRARAKAVLDYLNGRSENFRHIFDSLSCQIDAQTSNDLLGQIHRSRYSAMRFSEVVLHLQHLVADTLAATPPAEAKTAASDTSSVNISSVNPQDTAAGQLPVEQAPSDAMAPSAQQNNHTAARRPVLFVKTNLLYDLLTFVNASVELPLGRNITAEATLVYPWWRNTSRHKTVQMRYVAVTPRYYFKNNDNPYTSLFAGLSIGAGKYDLQWTRRGVQGTMWHISPTIGYSHHIGKRWKMEYAASVGFIQTKYKKYTQIADTPYGEIKVRDYPWVTKVLNTVLPTSLSVSLVYTFTSSKPARHHAQ